MKIFHKEKKDQRFSMRMSESCKKMLIDKAEAMSCTPSTLIEHLIEIYNTDKGENNVD